MANAAGTVKHVVLVRFKESTTQQKIAEIFRAIGNLRESIPGILDYTWGPYESPEGLNKGFTYGFVSTFANAASRDVYLTHPEHMKVVELALPELNGGLDGIIAFDWVVQ